VLASAVRCSVRLRACLRVPVRAPQFKSMARERGMNIGEQVGRILDGTTKRYGKDIENFLESQVKVLGSKVEAVICFIGNKSADNAKEVCRRC
jgi:hypothetical protein